MEMTTEDTLALQKTRELCQAILDEPFMQTVRQRIDAFMGDDEVRSRYDDLISKGQALQHKQQQALPLTGEEISDFEQHRDALMQNPVARDFLDAQEQIHQIQHSIQQHVTKTLELGRLPTAEDLNGGSCGHGCGCSH